MKDLEQKLNELIKTKAHDFSHRFISRKTMVHDPMIALAYEDCAQSLIPLVLELAGLLDKAVNHWGDYAPNHPSKARQTLDEAKQALENLTKKLEAKP